MKLQAPTGRQIRTIINHSLAYINCKQAHINISFFGYITTPQRHTPNQDRFLDYILLSAPGLTKISMYVNAIIQDLLINNLT